jgi:hypothetical protein
MQNKLPYLWLFIQIIKHGQFRAVQLNKTLYFLMKLVFGVNIGNGI